MDFQSGTLTRRAWIRSAAVTAGGAAVALAQPGLDTTPPMIVLKPKPRAPARTPGFQHRGYLGWITDLATEPDPEAAWPSMRLDDRLLEDYRRTFEVLQRLKFNEISIWGLYVARAWPTDVERAVPAERGERVERLIALAHERGIKVLAGLGVYSWGFEEIIRQEPRLARGNPQAMCPHVPQSWDWMRRVIDFAFTRFPIDGVSLQSADQGRCHCPECAPLADADYHALLNVRTAEYIRSRWPARTIGVNSWGLRFGDPAALPALLRIGSKVDYLIDVNDSANLGEPGYRRKLIDSLPCAFGTLGGPQVEPPQHWARDRWFLPTVRRNAEHLHGLADDGGRACEYFFHILANPGDELSLHVAGRMLANPSTPWPKHLQSALDELYEPPSARVRDDLAIAFLAAEEAWFTHRPSTGCGTISLEPLVSDRPGPPIYLTEGFTAEQRRAYAEALKEVRRRMAMLAPELPRQARIQSALRCLDTVLAELKSLSA